MAATNPVRRVGRDVHEVDFVVNVRGILSQLAALPPTSDASYVTVSVDLRPEGSDPQRRGGVDQIRRELDELAPPSRDRTPRADSLREDRDRIVAVIDEHVGGEAHGLIIVACAATNVFEVIPLGLPVPTEVAEGSVPSLTGLARFAEDFPIYGALLLDQEDARFSVIAQGRRKRSLRVRGSGYPNKQASGGFAQMRYQRRADERNEHFARGVAEEVQQSMEKGKLTMLVLAGDDQNTQLLREMLHPSVQDLIVGNIRMPIESTDIEVAEATQGLVNEAERQREADTVSQVMNGVGGATGAAAGAVDVLRALQAGQVQTLVMNDDFSETGWADYSMEAYGVGDLPSEHPTGGDIENIIEVPLEQELIRLALQTGAEVEVVLSEVPVSDDPEEEIRDPDREDMPRAEPAKELDKLGGVGAILRFEIEPQ